MNINQKITHWLNGSDMSFRKRGRLSFEKLLQNISVETGVPGDSSLGDIYEHAYGSFPVLKEKTVRSKGGLSLQWEEDPLLRPLVELVDYVQNNFSRDEILGFYVHGSYATMDYIHGYSDLDTLVIVRRCVLEDPAWTEDFRRRLVTSNSYLYLLDPLQHHPHFVLSEFDLSHFFEPLFPLVLFDYSIELTTFDEPIRCRLHNPANLLKEIFETFCSYLEDPESHGIACDSSFGLKQYVQCILLMPALYLQLVTGNYLYKKDTFDAAREKLPALCWDVVDRATSVRNTCVFHTRYPYMVRRLMASHFHYHTIHRLHRYFDRNITGCMKQILGPDYRSQTRALVKAMRESIRG